MKPSIPYVKMALHPFGLDGLHRRNPWAAAWWSVALPGLGHFYLGSNAKGLILMVWEIVVNTMSNLNLAIYHALLGHPEVSREVLVMKWAVIYPPVYMLAVWDAYRCAVSNNRICELEELQAERVFQSHTLSFYGQNALSRRNPWVAFFWSLLLGGAGHFYNMQLIKGVILMGWHFVISQQSGLSEAIVHTLLGQWDLAKQCVDYQWLLFWPSIHMFNVWNAYVDCVEQNKLSDEALLYRLRHGGPGSTI